MNDKPSGNQKPGGPLGYAAVSFDSLLAQLNSLGERGINYMLCVAGTAILVYLAVAAVTGQGHLSTAEFITLAAAAVAIAIAGAGLRAIGASASLRESESVTQSTLDLAKKALEGNQEARERLDELWR